MYLIHRNLDPRKQWVLESEMSENVKHAGNLGRSIHMVDEIITILWWSSCPKALNLVHMFLTEVAIHSLHDVCYILTKNRMDMQICSRNPSSPMSFWLAGTDQAACRTRLSWSHTLSVDTSWLVRRYLVMCSDVLACLLGGPPGLADFLVLWFSSVLCLVPLLSFFHYSREYCLGLRCATFHCSWVAVFCSSWKSVCLDSTVCQELNSDRLCASSYIFVRVCHVLEDFESLEFRHWLVLDVSFDSLTNSFYGCKLHTNTFVVCLDSISRLQIYSPTARTCPKYVLGNAVTSPSSASTMTLWWVRLSLYSSCIALNCSVLSGIQFWCVMYTSYTV